MRVSELAKKLNKQTSRLLEELRGLGLSVKTHSSTIRDQDVPRVMAQLAKKISPDPAPSPPTVKRVLIKKKAPEAPSAGSPPHLSQAAEPELPPPAMAVQAPTLAAREQTVPSTPPTSSAADQGGPAKHGGGGVSQQSPLEAPPVPPPPVGVQAPPSPAAVPSASLVEERPAPPPERPEPAVTTMKTEALELIKRDERDRVKERFRRVQKLRQWKEELRAGVPHPLSPLTPVVGRDGVQGTVAPVAEHTKPRKKEIKLSEGTTVKTFAEAIGQKPIVVQKKLFEMGIVTTFNQFIDISAAALVAEQYGLKVDAVQEPTEEELLHDLPDDPDSLRPRPPVVTIMGHVDHGKTTLLDAIRQTKVAEQEAGGITQHIGAYSVEVGGKTIVFLDTPGHEAFTAMRARGASVTDIVVLVVAADDGVMPQTIEAIDHARAAGVPIIVAINKIDKPEANAERVKRALAEHGLLPEAWGGTMIFTEVSAKKKLGLDALLELIPLQAEVLELKANPDRPARGTVIEAKLDRGRGPVVTALIQKGTLRPGDAFVCGRFSGRVRALLDDLGRRVTAAGPGTPIAIIGSSGVPNAGDVVAAVESEQVAKEIAMVRQQRQRLVEMGRTSKVTLEDLYARIQAGTKNLNLILKADVQGSVEAIASALQKLSTEAVKVRILHSGAAGISESDVLLAAASNAIIIGFHVEPDERTTELAKHETVQILTYTVIYDVLAHVHSAMEGLLEPVIEERILGKAEVRQTYRVPKMGTVAGLYVVEGVVSRSATGVRLYRGKQMVHEGKMASLRRFKDDVREVSAGYECGMGLEHFADIQVGDLVELYVQDKVAAKLGQPA